MWPVQVKRPRWPAPSKYSCPPKAGLQDCHLSPRFVLAAGIETWFSAWGAAILPLSYINTPTDLSIHTTIYCTLLLKRKDDQECSLLTCGTCYVACLPVDCRHHHQHHHHHHMFTCETSQGGGLSSSSSSSSSLSVYLWNQPWRWTLIIIIICLPVKTARAGGYHRHHHHHHRCLFTCGTSQDGELSSSSSSISSSVYMWN